MCWEDTGTGQSGEEGEEKLAYLHGWAGWRTDGAARKGYPQVFQRLMTLVAWLLRHQLTVPCLCLFVTKDTVLSNYK